MATLTGFGGLGEIGGNAFLLEDRGGRLLLDIGKRFGGVGENNESLGVRPGWGDYWDEFLKPRSFRLLADLATLDLVPPLPSLYRTDLGGQGGPSPVDAVIVSHAHMDHVGLLGLLRPDVPVHTSLETRATLASIQTTGLGGAESDFVDLAARSPFHRNKDGSLAKTVRSSAGPMRAFESGAKADVGPWRLEHYGVDHSIHGARAVVVSGPGINLAYTGDFRLHGRSRHATEKFLERAQGVDFLLTEGTRVHRPSDRERFSKETDQEVDVEGELELHVTRASSKSGTSGFVAIGFPPRDLDRFVSVWNVARKAGRRLAITTKQAHLLDTMRAVGRTDLPDPRVDPSIAIHLRPKRKGTILAREGVVRVAREDLTLEDVHVASEELGEFLLSDYDAWERPYVTCPNTISSLNVGREPTAFLLSLTYWSVTDLLDCFPNPVAASGLYIHSATQPFNDEMEQNDRKLNQWLRLFHLERADTHVSGHLGEKDLDWAIDRVGARVLVPIHSVGSAITADRFEARTGRKALLPQAGQPVDLASR